MERVRDMMIFQVRIASTLAGILVCGSYFDLGNFFC